MVASCGCGHCLLSKASATTFWSGRLTWILVDSPGMIILLVLTDTSGCLAGVVLYCPCRWCIVLCCTGIVLYWVGRYCIVLCRTHIVLYWACR